MPVRTRPLCVVKTVRSELAHDIELVDRFLDEGRVLCALSHSNIGQVYEVAMEGNTPPRLREYQENLETQASNSRKSRNESGCRVGYAQPLRKDSGLSDWECGVFAYECRPDELAKTTSIADRSAAA